MPKNFFKAVDTFECINSEVIAIVHEMLQLRAQAKYGRKHKKALKREWQRLVGLMLDCMISCEKTEIVEVDTPKQYMFCFGEEDYALIQFYYRKDPDNCTGKDIDCEVSLFNVAASILS